MKNITIFSLCALLLFTPAQKTNASEESTWIAAVKVLFWAAPVAYSYFMSGPSSNPSTNESNSSSTGPQLPDNTSIPQVPSFFSYEKLGANILQSFGTAAAIMLLKNTATFIASSSSHLMGYYQYSSEINLVKTGIKIDHSLDFKSYDDLLIDASTSINLEAYISEINNRLSCNKILSNALLLGSNSEQLRILTILLTQNFQENVHNLRIIHLSSEAITKNDLNLEYLKKFFKEINSKKKETTLIIIDEINKLFSHYKKDNNNLSILNSFFQGSSNYFILGVNEFNSNLINSIENSQISKLYNNFKREKYFYIHTNDLTWKTKYLYVLLKKQFNDNTKDNNKKIFPYDDFSQFQSMASNLYELENVADDKVESLSYVIYANASFNQKVIDNEMIQTALERQNNPFSRKVPKKYNQLEEISDTKQVFESESKIEEVEKEITQDETTVLPIPIQNPDSKTKKVKRIPKPKPIQRLPHQPAPKIMSQDFATSKNDIHKSKLAQPYKRRHIS